MLDAPRSPVLRSDAGYAQWNPDSLDRRNFDRRAFAIAVLVGLAYYVGARVGFALTFMPNPISVLWPPNSVLLAALLLAPTRLWWLFLLAALPAHLLAEVQAGVPILLVLGWFIGNASQALIGAICIRRWIIGPPLLESLPNVIVFLAYGVMLAPFLTSFLDAALVTAIGWGEADYWSLWSTRFFSNVLTTLTVVPLIIAIAARAAAPRVGTAYGRLVEWALLSCGLLITCFFVFDSPHSGSSSFALVYLPLPFLLWAAVRLGPLGISAAFMATSVLVIWGAGYGRGPFLGDTPAENGLLVQLFLISIAIPMYTLTAVMTERARAGGELRKSELRFASVFRAAPDAMIITRKESGQIVDVNDLWERMCGYERAEVVGSMLKDLDIYANRKAAADLIALVEEKGCVRNAELTVRNRSGDTWEGLVATDSVSIDGESCYITSIRDITERKRSAAALKASEERYREVVENQTELVCRYAPDTTLTFANDAFCRFYGGKRSELLGRRISDLVSAQAGQRLAACNAELSIGGPPGHYEQEVFAADGAVRWQHWVVYAIRNANGSTEMQAIGRDITDRKLAERSLYESNERFDLVMEATKDVIYDWDIPRNAVWFNNNGAALFGRAGHGREEPFWWADVVHTEDRDRVTSALQALIAGRGSNWDAEYRLQRIDGSFAYFNERGFVVRDADAKPVRMIGTLMDITDRRRAEDANERLAHASRLAVVGELTASVAHELNQPLGAILSNVDAAEMILDTEPLRIDELRLIIEDIRKDDIRASDVIRHMRALLRKRKMAMEPLDLNRAISDVLTLANADLTRRRIAVHTEFAPLPAVQGDPVHLQQVILNLILNGVDAMAQMPPSARRLELRTARETGGVMVCVTDAGSGLHPEHVEQLFESFFTTKENGMGLGLAIARSIVEAHGGRIWAEPGAQGGASFRFFVPAQPLEASGAQKPSAG